MGLERVFDSDLDLDGAHAGPLINLGTGGMHTIHKLHQTGG